MICIAMGKDFAQRLCAKSLGKDFEQGFKTLRKVFAQEMCSFAYSWPHVVIWLAPVQNRAQRLWAKLWAGIDPNGVHRNAVWVNPCSKLFSKSLRTVLDRSQSNHGMGSWKCKWEHFLGKDFAQCFKTLLRVFALSSKSSAQRLWAKLWARIDPNGVS